MNKNRIFHPGDIDTTYPSREELLAEGLDPEDISEEWRQLVQIRWDKTPKNEEGKYVIPHLQEERKHGKGKSHYLYGKSDKMRDLVMKRWAKGLDKNPVS